MGLGINCVILANHLVSLNTSSTRTPGVFCICIINDCPMPIYIAPLDLYPITYGCLLQGQSCIINDCPMPIYIAPLDLYPITYGCLLQGQSNIDHFSEIHLFLNEANNVL